MGGDIAFAPNGTLYSVLNRNLYVVPLAGGALTNRGAITNLVSAATGMAFDAQGRLVVAANGGQTSYTVANYASGTPTATTLGNTGSQVQDLGSMLSADVTISKSHSGNFFQGQSGASYSLVVSDSGNMATSGTVTVTDTLPTGLTPVSASGTGWTCGAPAGQVLSCTRSSALASGASYPAITITVNVAANAAPSITNTARVAGGGQNPANLSLAGNDASSDPTTVTAVAVAVTPDGLDTLRLLPSNGVVYRRRLAVANTGAMAQNHDLFAFGSGGVVLAVDSIRGAAVTFGARTDSARISGPAPGVTDSVDVYFRVAGVAEGSVGPIYLAARGVTAPAIRDSGWASIRVVRPSLVTSKSVAPAGSLAPGTDLTYTIAVTNGGTEQAVSVVTVDSVAPQVSFLVGSVVATLPAGNSVTVSYSNDGGASWAYTPVSAGCGAAAGFDDCVTHLRWVLAQPLGQSPPDNVVSYQFGARIK